MTSVCRDDDEMWWDQLGQIITIQKCTAFRSILGFETTRCVSTFNVQHWIARNPAWITRKCLLLTSWPLRVSIILSFSDMAHCRHRTHVATVSVKKWCLWEFIQELPICHILGAPYHVMPYWYWDTFRCSGKSYVLAMHWTCRENAVSDSLQLMSLWLSSNFQ